MSVEIVLQEHNDAVALELKLARSLCGFLATTGVYKNCLTCSHFVEAMETCSKYKARPPAKIIAYGCPDHTHNIPF